MILNKIRLPFKFITKTKINCSFINTEIIKQYQKELQKANPNSLRNYPKTFEEKAVILNDPRTVYILEIVEHGVKFKKGKNWLVLGLFSLALAGYILEKMLPIRIIDRYFMVSPESTTYISGYLFSGFNFQKPFYIYLPLIFGVYQLSRFVNISHMSLLIFANCVVGNILAHYLVNERVKKYEVWQNERLCFGEGNLLSISYAFWSYIGFKQAFTHLKSRLFLKAQQGVGIVRRGLPFGYLCIMYLALQIFFYVKGAKNSQVILAQLITGIVMGLVLRRIKPLIK